MIAFVKSMISYLPFRTRLIFKGRQLGYSPSKAQSKTRTETACRLHALPLLVKKARDVLDTGYPRYTWLWSNDFFWYRSSFTDSWEFLIIASGALGRWWHVWMLEKKKLNDFMAKSKWVIGKLWYVPFLCTLFLVLATTFRKGKTLKSHTSAFWYLWSKFVWDLLQQPEQHP